MKGKFLILILLAMASVSLTSCRQQEHKSGIRMGVLQNDIHHLAFWVAKDKGFFQEEGINIELTGIFRAGPEIMAAFSSGELDMAYVGEAPVTTAVANNSTQVTIVAQANTEGSALVVAYKDNIRGFADLKGKTVAVPGHSTVQDFLLRKIIQENGMKPGSINTVVLKPPEMIGALRTGNIEAFIAWEPYPAKAATMDVGYNLLTSSDMWANHPCCVLVSGNELMGKDRRAVQAIVDAHVKATEFIHGHPDEAIRICADSTGMDEPTIRQALKNVNFTHQLNIDGEMEYVRFLSEIGYIHIKRPDRFVELLIDSGFIEK